MTAARFLCAAAALASASPAVAELDLNRAQVTHLSNGLTVILLEDHSFPLVSVQMLYKSGSAAEISGKTGLAHFLEHLAFRGSENFPNARATELIYDSGGEWHGYTAMDQTTYFATMPRGGLDLLLRIEADRMARTIIDAASIEAEKGAVITELHSYENDPASVLLESVTRTAIQAHPYGSPMAGYVSDVTGLTAADARAYYASHYSPGNAVLAVVGDFALADARSLVVQRFATVAARPVALPNPTWEPTQRGERRVRLQGPVERQYFQLVFPSPAASNPDFGAFLLLQQILSGGSGLNLHQRDWSGTAAADGALLSGTTADIATWLPPTHDAFLFTVSGSITAKADPAALERDIARLLATVRDRPVTDRQLARAKAAVTRALADDVLTTEDAAHQLAFFEGIGALDDLLAMPHRIAAITAADIQRVARTYLDPNRRTIGWMVPGRVPTASPGAATPRPAANRSGAAAPAMPAGQPELRGLAGGLPAIVQASPLSDTATVELLMSAAVDGGASPPELPRRDAVIRSGKPGDVAAMISQVIAAANRPRRIADPRSADPATRLEQLIAAQIDHPAARAPKPLAIVVTGKVDPDSMFAMLELQLGSAAPGRTAEPPAPAPPAGPGIICERIATPLSQGGIGYVVEGPRPGTREALAWRMLLYVLTHDYSGRLGRSAITDKGIVYHIYSTVRTDGARIWVTLSSGVDPDRADAFEAELRSHLASLVSEPPSAAETDAARANLLGRDATAAQSNEELAAKITRQFVETGGLRSHDQLRALAETVTPADLAAATRAFAGGTIIRVDVGAPAK